MRATKKYQRKSLTADKLSYKWNRLGIISTDFSCTKRIIAMFLRFRLVLCLSNLNKINELQLLTSQVQIMQRSKMLLMLYRTISKKCLSKLSKRFWIKWKQLFRQVCEKSNYGSWKILHNQKNFNTNDGKILSCIILNQGQNKLNKIIPMEFELL